MRVLSVGFGLLFLTAVAVAQAPPPKAPAARPAPARPLGTLAQVMRGILFPNANIIFDAQSNDPALPKPKPQGTGALADFANIYTGWPVVENAAIALNQSVDLILKPGRLCQNGKPVQVGRADFQKYAQGLRDASKKIYDLAKTKDLEKVSDAANDLSDACSSCHEPYRDKGDADNPLRCTPPTAAEQERIDKGLR